MAWVVVLALIVPHVITSSYTYVESRVLYRLRDHKTHFEQVPYEQKQDLFMSYVNRNVFEIGVDRVPVLQPLFRQFEKQKRLIVKGAKMSDFDKSCRRYYEDSLSMSGDFDRAFYAEVEASKERNGMNECKFDGEVGDIEGWLKKHKFWGKGTKQNPLLRKLALGINMPEADGKPLERLYGEVMKSLGFVEEAGSVDSVFGRTSFEGVKHVKNFSYLPQNLFYSSLALQSDWRDGHVWMILAKLFFQSKNPNDGVVDIKSARYPHYFHGVNLGILNGHHLIGTRTSEFPQEALLEAHIIFKDYYLATKDHP